MSSPVFGFADLHCHTMAHLGFGGHLLAGFPDGDVQNALARCDIHLHGPWGLGQFGKNWSLLQVFIEDSLGHGPCGHGSFEHWPKFTTMVHQQIFVDWLKRAYDGGLRLLCSVAVNNELLADQIHHADKDESSIEKQMRELRRFTERHSDWMGLALSASQARQLIQAGKMAVVAGVEVDSLDSLLGDRAALNKKPLSLEHLPRILEWLRAQGFRMMTPLHLANNSFGGAAVYDDKFNILNHFLRGSFLQVEDNSSVTFRLGDSLDTQTKVSVIFYELTQRAHYPKGYALNAPGKGHVNQLGLTPTGKAFLREAMRQGFILDVEHIQQPGPRYGPNAAFGLMHDKKREKRRPVQQQLQRNHPPLPYTGNMYRTNAPFVPSRTGKRTFDFNTDGLAHIGLLPDFIRDLVHVGMTDAQLDPLFSSAEAFLRMWEACEARGAALTAGEPVS